MGFYFDSVFEHRPLMDKTQMVEDSIQKSNMIYTVVFYVYVGIVILLFSLFKFWRRIYVQNRSIRQDVQILARPTRIFRQWCIRKAFWPFATRGHMLVILGYLILNILLALMSSGMRFLVLQTARRLGWLSIINYTLLIFLSMKNTPLSKLTGYSYERLNFLHRWVGVVAWIEGSVHTVAISFALSRLVPDQTHMLLYADNIAGIVALAAWTLMLVSYPLFKRKLFEWFFVLHIILFPVVTVALYLHNVHCQIPILVGAGIYVLDRLIRYDRFFWHNKNAKKLKASIKLSSDGSTLLSVPRNFDWTPGSHAFLNIPRVNYFESHPFSIASISDDSKAAATAEKTLDFIIKPKCGFTRALVREARKTPEELPRGFSKELTTYIDGPYGGAPDFNGFDRVVLLGAGAGITFTLPIALSLVRSGRVKSLDFIWAVREAKSFESIREQLLELSRNVVVREHGTAVNLRLHITGSTSMPGVGTLQRIKSLMQREQMPDEAEYDLYDPSMAPSTAPSVHASTADLPSMPAVREKHSDDSINSSTWLDGNHNRTVSSQSQQSAVSADDTIYPQRSSNIGLAISLPDDRPTSMQTPELAKNFRLMSPSLIRTGRPMLEINTRPSRTASPSSMGSHSRSPSIVPPPQTYQASERLSGPTVIATPAINIHPAPESVASGRSSAMSVSKPGDDELRRSLRDPLKRFHVYGRPSIPHLLADVVMHAERLETIGVAACGIAAWTQEVRKVVADSMEARGPSLSVFCEEFGY